jgi:hypothetical protein
MLKKKKKKKTKSKSDSFLQSIQRKNPRECEGFLCMVGISAQWLGFATPLGQRSPQTEQPKNSKRSRFWDHSVILRLEGKENVQVCPTDGVEGRPIDVWRVIQMVVVQTVNTRIDVARKHGFVLSKIITAQNCTTDFFEAVGSDVIGDLYCLALDTVIVDPVDGEFPVGTVEC